MTAEQIAQQLGCEVVCGGQALGKEITGGYCGDLLSWVMSRLKAGDAWITVMGNINSIAVAVLADAGCVILAEDAQLDDEAEEKARLNNVAVLRSGKNVFTLAVQLGNLLAA